MASDKLSYIVWRMVQNVKFACGELKLYVSSSAGGLKKKKKKSNSLVNSCLKKVPLPPLKNIPRPPLHAKRGKERTSIAFWFPSLNDIDRRVTGWATSNRTRECLGGNHRVIHATMTQVAHPATLIIPCMARAYGEAPYSNGKTLCLRSARKCIASCCRNFRREFLHHEYSSSREASLYAPTSDNNDAFLHY